MMQKSGFIFILLLLLTACKVNYSFSGVSVSKDIHTFQVDYIPNNASYIVPGLNEDFRNQLIDRINRQTSLTEVSSDGDLIFQGEITQYETQPIAATAQQTAGENRLSVTLSLDFINNKKEADNYTKQYTFYYDYPANATLEDIQDEAHKYIFEKILDAIFNDTLAKW